MKVTFIVGSGRSQGSSSYLADIMINGMSGKRDLEIKKYIISEMKINYCIGCKECYKRGYCFQSDDVSKIIKDVLSSDTVVMISPSYWAGVPAQLKTLFDRTTPYGDTNPNRVVSKSKDSKGIAIAIRAGSHHEENELILNSIEHYFGHLGIVTKKRISIIDTDSLEDLERKHQDIINELYCLGEKIAGK